MQSCADSKRTSRLTSDKCTKTRHQVSDPKSETCTSVRFALSFRFGSLSFAFGLPTVGFGRPAGNCSTGDDQFAPISAGYCFRAAFANLCRRRRRRGPSRQSRGAPTTTTSTTSNENNKHQQQLCRFETVTVWAASAAAAAAARRLGGRLAADERSDPRQLSRGGAPQSGGRLAPPYSSKLAQASGGAKSLMHSTREAAEFVSQRE